MITPAVVPLVDEGLGNSSYLVDLDDGRALVIDPSIDLRGVRRVADRRGLRIAFAADTHLHADFLTGARQLAASDGATILASAQGRRPYDHVALRDGDEVDLGGLRLRALTTPGHTDEHLAFLLLDGDRPLGVFSGGALIVGAVARTDLVEPSRTEELAHAQYQSVQRLIALPDTTLLWPTHGAGSFCSAPHAADRTSTIGRERTANPLLQTEDEDAFVDALVRSFGSYPPYFRKLGEVNRAGPAVLRQEPALAPLTVAQTEMAVARVAALGVVRPMAAYAAWHIPSSLSIHLRDAFATWLGWLVPFGNPVVVIRAADQDPAEISWQAAKIGYSLVGELAGGIDMWKTAGRSISRTPLVTALEAQGRRVLDVRQRDEFTAGHVSNAVHIELGDLAARVADLHTRKLVVMCGHGERAMSAASVIERATGQVVSVLVGGPDELAAAAGTALETGS
jgi:glyoxylase-like metal-dependent hydrolase (beta-lactamase superfamily II)/rhodanese-related sulfurtransferase